MDGRFSSSHCFSITRSSSRVTSSTDRSLVARDRTDSASLPKAALTACADSPDSMDGTSLRAGISSRSGRRGAAISTRGSGRDGSGSITLPRSLGGSGAGSSSRQLRRGISFWRAAARLAARCAGSTGETGLPARAREIFSRSCWISLAAAASSSPTRGLTGCGGADAAGARRTTPAGMSPISSWMALRIEASRSSMRGSAVTSSTLNRLTNLNLSERITRGDGACRYVPLSYSTVLTSVPIHLLRTRL